MKTNIICIGGIPGTGKTTLSYNLSSKLKVDKILNIDLIKSMIKSFDLSTNKYILSTSHEAYKIDNLDPINGYYRYADNINEYVIKLLNNLTNERIIIVEGVSINDSFIQQINHSLFNYIYFNITTNHEELKTRYVAKNKIRKGKWLNNIDIILKIEEELTKNNHGITIENNNLQECLKKMEEFINENIYLQ